MLCKRCVLLLRDGEEILEHRGEAVHQLGREVGKFGKCLLNFLALCSELLFPCCDLHQSLVELGALCGDLFVGHAGELGKSGFELLLLFFELAFTRLVFRHALLILRLPRVELRLGSGELVFRLADLPVVFGKALVVLLLS